MTTSSRSLSPCELTDDIHIFSFFSLMSIFTREFWTPSNLIVCFSEYEIMKFHGYGSEDLYDEVAQWIGDMSGVDVSELPGHWLVKLFDELKIEEVDSQ